MYKTIMVPLDGSELAECVLPHVEAFIKEFNLSDVILARVVEPETYSYHPETYSYREGGPSFDPQVIARRELERKENARDYLDRVAKRLEHEGTALRKEVLVGRVTERLIDCAEQNHVGLIFIATHGRSGVTRWVRGSVADKILRSANVPVLMVRAPGTRGGI